MLILYFLHINFKKFFDLQVYLGLHLHSGNMDSKTIHSTIDAPPGVPGVSKDAPGSPEHGIWGLVR